jgi:hypothetical protein
VTAFPEGEDRVVVVMVGNPRITGRDLSIKATTIVAWFDRRKAPEFVGYQGLQAPKDAPAGATGAKAETSGPGRASVFPEALLGVYAQGAVELVTGPHTFRADEAYIDPVASYALLVKPRLDTTLAVPGVEDVPLHVRAERARIVGQGLAVFDRADVATSRANDRIELRVRQMTVEEFGAPAPNEQTFLGFRPRDTQRYRARGIVVRGERLPLLYWPSAAFGLGEGGPGEFPVRIRRVTTGSRSSLGRYGLLGVGGEIGPDGDPWVDWILDVGGYSKRGPAVGVELSWDRPGREGVHPTARGTLRTFYVHDASGDDRNAFDAPEPDRWKVNLENRSELSRALRLDVEANDFSDRNFNREFFESDERNHKERETYARLRWMRGGQAATLTQMAHLREFRTETILSPEAGFWSESVTLPGGIDLSTEARAGWLERRFDHGLPDDDYDAYRIDVRQRAYRPVNLGDVRVSPFVGVRATSYAERTDGGDDLTRLAVEAGVRANLQLHRDYPVCGGPLRLDGLRHVVDVDVGVLARAFDPYEPEDVPFFDRHDLEEDRTEILLALRNRLETSRPGPHGRRNSGVFDLRTRVSLWPGEVGPYGKRGPGNAAAKLDCELLPERLYVRGEGVFDFGEATLEHGSIGALVSPREGLSFAGGLRQVHDEVLALWFDAYWRWSEKWGGRVSTVRDLEGDRTNRIRLSILRFSVDHMLRAGMTVEDEGRDVGFFLDFTPAIGGRPLSDPFHPREEIDYEP